MLILSLLLYFLPLFPLVSLMRIKQHSRYLSALFIILIAEIILTGNLLGLLHLLNNKLAWIIVQVCLVLIAWGLWLLLKRPALFGFHIEKPNFNRLSILQKITLVLLSLAVVVGYSILIYLIMVVPPNNNDSMLVHLTRVGYWLQHGSFAPWNSLIERQVIYPFNAQIVVLWTVLFQGTDLFAAFLQFFSVLFTAMGIYAIGRDIGGSRFQSGIPALLYLTFPQVILQATTTQDDLVITCFLVLGSHFFIRWFSKGYTEKTDLILASISLVIALGIKPTAFYFFIGFALFIGLLLLLKKMSFKHLIQLGIACLGFFVILSSFAYINNTIYFKTPLGPSEFVKAESGAFNGNVFQKTGTNAGRFIYQFFSLDGLPATLTQSVQDLKVNIALKLPGLFNTSSGFLKDSEKPFILISQPGINEDYSWFGPVSFLLLIPVFILGIYHSAKKKDLKVVFLIMVSFFIMIGISSLRPGWDPFQGRYFNPGIAIIMPLGIYVLDKNLIRQIYISLLSFLAILILICSVTMNDAKPLLTQATIKRTFSNPAFSCKRNMVLKYSCYLANLITPYLPQKADIFALDRLGRQTYTNQSQKQILAEIPQVIPANSRIGLSLQIGEWEYPFFGEHFEYHLVPLSSLAVLKDPIWFEEAQIMYLVIHTNPSQENMNWPGFVLLEEFTDPMTNSVWKILKNQ